MKKGTILKNLWAGHETYFVYMGFPVRIKGKVRPVRSYFERHGWKECGGYSGEVCVDGKEYAGHTKYVKRFRSEDERKNEMEDIYTFISLME